MGAFDHLEWTHNGASEQLLGLGRGNSNKNSNARGLPGGECLSFNLTGTLDLARVTERNRHKLKRRKYNSSGPNYCWHVDGNDKQKPFGFPIHGAVDGYSRRVS